MSEAAGVLVIGFGNPGRLDDGLGPAAAAAIERLGLPGVAVDADYQLNVEDAERASRYPLVLFLDADATGPEPFGVQRVRPQRDVSFSTHSVQPAEVMGLATDLFAAATQAYVVGIRGYAFDGFGEDLTAAARGNLNAAVDFVTELLRPGDIDAMMAQLDTRAGASR